MKSGRRKNAVPEEKKRGPDERGPEANGEASQESCRCKEVSKKSLSELLKVAVSDLSFWKKEK